MSPASSAPAAAHLVGPDLVRIAAAALVVILHGLMPGVPAFGARWYLETAAVVLAKSCVLLFLLLNGYLCAHVPPSSLSQFYRRRFVRLAPVVLFASALGLGWRVAFHHEVWTWSLVGRLLTGEPAYFHLWFLVLMIPLTVATPWLAVLARSLSAAGWLALGATFLFSQTWPVLSRQFAGTGVPDSYFSSLGYGLLVLLGAGIRGHEPQILKRIRPAHGLGLLAGLVIAETFLVRLFTLQPMQRDETLLTFLRPNIVLQSLLVFVTLLHWGNRLAGKSNSFPALLASLAATSVGIYVLHPFLLESLWHTWPGLAESGWTTGTAIAAAGGGSFLIARLLAAIPVMKRLLG